MNGRSGQGMRTCQRAAIPGPVGLCSVRTVLVPSLSPCSPVARVCGGWSSLGRDGTASRRRRRRWTLNHSHIDSVHHTTARVGRISQSSFLRTPSPKPVISDHGHDLHVYRPPPMTAEASPGFPPFFTVFSPALTLVAILAGPLQACKVHG